MYNKKGKLVRTGAMLLSLAMAVTAVGVSTEAEAAAKPKLAKKTVSVKVGKTVKISIKGKKIKKTTWSVKSKKIAKLSKKKKTSVTVKGVKAGSTKVTAKVKAGKKTYTLKATVKVKKAKDNKDDNAENKATATPPAASAAPATATPATSPSATSGSSNSPEGTQLPPTQDPNAPITLSQTEATLDYYKSITLTATAKDPNAKVEWSTSDEKIATVKDGVVTAVGEDKETAVITAKAGNDTATCKVTVNKIPLGTVVVEEDFESGEAKYTGPRNTNDDAVTEIADGGNAGSKKCFRVMDRVSIAQGAVVDLTNICEPGSTYDFSAYIKAGDNVKNEKVSLIISSEIKAVETGEESYDNLAVITKAQGNFQGEAEEHYADPKQWNQIKYTFTAPDDMYHFGLYLETKLDKCDLYIDDIKITLKDRNKPDYKIESLGAAYKDIFTNFGVGASYDNFLGENASTFIKTQFDSFTPGNCYKPDAILPPAEDFANMKLTIAEAKEKGYYIPENYESLEGNKSNGEIIVPELNFTRVDQVLEKAHQLGIKVRFHTLVWHQQTPIFFFKDKYKLAETADNTDQETMNSRLDFYINTVLDHVLKKDLELAGGDKSKCKLYSIDVVNEYTHSANASDKKVNRNGITFYEEIYGKDADGKYLREKNGGAMSSTPAYVKYSFKLAYDALERHGRQDIMLTNNDFNEYYPNTTKELIDLIKYINEKDDLNPDGKQLCEAVGMQMHLSMGSNDCSVDKIKTAVDKFVAAGLQIEVTEWDAGISENTDAKLTEQAKYYKDIMKIFIENKANVKTMTLWSLYDALSWRYESYPCPFKGLYNIKPAYTALLEAAKEAK